MIFKPTSEFPLTAYDVFKMVRSPENRLSIRHQFNTINYGKEKIYTLAQPGKSNDVGITYCTFLGGCPYFKQVQDCKKCLISSTKPSFCKGYPYLLSPLINHKENSFEISVLDVEKNVRLSAKDGATIITSLYNFDDILGFYNFSTAMLNLSTLSVTNLKVYYFGLDVLFNFDYFFKEMGVKIPDNSSYYSVFYEQFKNPVVSRENYLMLTKNLVPIGVVFSTLKEVLSPYISYVEYKFNLEYFLPGRCANAT